MADDELGFGDVVTVEGEAEEYFVIGLTLSDVTVITKNEWDDRYFGYTIQHVPHSKVRLV